MSSFAFSWSELAYGSKKPVNELKAMFIVAPRELSKQRFTELVKTYLPKGNILLGIADEDWVAGFEDQPQFKTLELSTIQPVIDAVNNSKSPHKIYTINYSQKETNYLLEKLKLKRAVLVNGSWLHAFHTRPEYYTLVNRAIPFELVSPFVDETEAKTFAAKQAKKLRSIDLKKHAYTTEDMLALADAASTHSYDYMFQTGTALGIQKGKGYEPFLTSYNKVAPYETYAMHFGASREANFSPPNDLNHYDTAHAEVMLLIEAAKRCVSLKNTTLFINLMPCPPCSRMIAETDISEVVYRLDHSDGYGLRMLEAAGKTVRRVV